MLEIKNESPKLVVEGVGRSTGENGEDGDTPTEIIH